MSQLAHIRPRSATEIVDASFRFYRARFGDLLVVSALLLAPPAVLGAIAPDSAERLIGMFARWMYYFSQGAIAVLVAAALERNEALSAGEVFRRLNGRWLKLITTSWLSALMIILGLVLLIVPGIIALSWTMVALPVAAIEGRASSPATERSRALARGRMPHVLGTMALVWIIVVALFFGAAFSLSFIPWVSELPERLIGMISELLLVPLAPVIGIAVTLLYYDLRVRTEGADVSAMIGTLPVTRREVLTRS
jgi:hypothetical protein